MHRSHSATRVSDEYHHHRPSDVEVHHRLPLYSPISDVAKRENSRLRSAENAVHLIPLILVLCAVILWFFSNPVDMNKKPDSILASVEGLKAAGSMDIDGTHNGLPHQHLHPEIDEVILPHHHHQHQHIKPDV